VTTMSVLFCPAVCTTARSSSTCFKSHSSNRLLVIRCSSPPLSSLHAAPTLASTYSPTRVSHSPKAIHPPACTPVVPLLQGQVVPRSCATHTGEMHDASNPRPHLVVVGSGSSDEATEPAEPAVLPLLVARRSANVLLPAPWSARGLPVIQYQAVGVSFALKTR